MLLLTSSVFLFAFLNNMSDRDFFVTKTCLCHSNVIFTEIKPHISNLVPRRYNQNQHTKKLKCEIVHVILNKNVNNFFYGL